MIFGVLASFSAPNDAYRTPNEMNVSTKMFSVPNEPFGVADVKCAKHRSVKGKQIPETVKKAVAARLHRARRELDDVSYREITRRSGGAVSPGHLTSIFAGEIEDMKVLTLLGLARALEVSPHELIDILSGVEEPPTFNGSDFWEIQRAYESIAPESRELPEQMLKTVLDILKRSVPKNKQAEKTGGSRAARKKLQS